MPICRIGVLSDTHGPLPDKVFELMDGNWDENELWGRVWRQALCRYDGQGRLFLEEASVGTEPAGPRPPLPRRRCDLIVHAGDIGPQSVLDELGAIARTVAVLGNNDYDRYWCSDGDARAFRSLDADGLELCVAHIPRDLDAALHGRGPLQPPLVKREPHLAIHGHTHVPKLAQQGNHALLCPGSPTRGRNGSGRNVALVDVVDGRLESISFVEV